MYYITIIIFFTIIFYFSVRRFEAIEKSIIKGTGNNKFTPDVACAREQMGTFLHRYFAD